MIVLTAGFNELLLNIKSFETLVLKLKKQGLKFYLYEYKKLKKKSFFFFFPQRKKLKDS